jgi:hypothetical protein
MEKLMKGLMVESEEGAYEGEDKILIVARTMYHFSIP